MIAQDLSKTYKRKTILDSVDWQVGVGVFGLIGPAGAGKSVLLKILSGAMRPSNGIVTIDEINLANHPDEFRQQIGYLPQDFSPNMNGTIFELMTTAGVFKGLTQKNERIQTIKAILQQVELWDSRHRKVKTLPIGMMKRLGVAQALLNDPKILLLDEPTIGLSPLERVCLLRLISQYGKAHTVIFSTQYASDIIHCCRKVTVINSGRLLFNGSLRDMVHIAQNKNKKISRKEHFNIYHPAVIQKLDAFEKRQPNDAGILSLAFMDGYQQIVGGFLK